MKPIRSFLFVPGHRESWIDKIPGYQADAVILDLEDSVPEAQKAEARDLVKRKIAFLSERGERVYVRINRSPFIYSLEDLLAVVVPGLEGVVLPKPNGPEDMHLAAMMVSEAESRNGVAQGTIGIAPTLETARSLQYAHAIARHPRVTALGCAAARNGDVARSAFNGRGRGSRALPGKPRPSLPRARRARCRWPGCGRRCTTSTDCAPPPPRTAASGSWGK